MRATILFLQRVYASAPETGYRWAGNDPSASRIAITADLPVPAEAIGARPHIAVYFGGLQWSGLGMDQLRSASFFSDQREHQDLITGVLTFATLSRNSEEAAYIAWHTAKFLWLLRRILLVVGFHDIGQNISMSAPSTPGSLIQGDGGEELTVVYLTAPFSFAWGATVVPVSDHTIEEFEIAVATELGESLTPTIPVARVGSGTVDTEGRRLFVKADPMAALGSVAERRKWRAVPLDNPPVITPSEELVSLVIVEDE
jgi:hypothetical protein